jgi:hypothetical protein
MKGTAKKKIAKNPRWAREIVDNYPLDATKFEHSRLNPKAKANIDAELLKCLHEHCEIAMFRLAAENPWTGLAPTPQERADIVWSLCFAIVDFLAEEEPIDLLWPGPDAIIAALRMSATVGFESLYAVVQEAIGFFPGDLWRRGCLAEAAFDPIVESYCADVHTILFPELIGRRAIGVPVFFAEMRTSARFDPADRYFQPPQTHGRYHRPLFALSTADNPGSRPVEGAQSELALTHKQALELAEELEASSKSHNRRVGADLRLWVESDIASRLLRRELAIPNSLLITAGRAGLVSEVSPLGSFAKRRKIISPFKLDEYGKLKKRRPSEIEVLPEFTADFARRVRLPGPTPRGVFGSATFICVRTPDGGVRYEHRYTGDELEELRRIHIGSLPLIEKI